VQEPILSADATTCRLLKQASLGRRGIAAATQRMSGFTIHIDRPATKRCVAVKPRGLWKFSPSLYFRTLAPLLHRWEGRVGGGFAGSARSWFHVGLSSVFALVHRTRSGTEADAALRQGSGSVRSNSFSMTQVRSPLAGCWPITELEFTGTTTSTSAGMTTADVAFFFPGDLCRPRLPRKPIKMEKTPCNKSLRDVSGIQRIIASRS
jgi:hypothetical protein